MLRDYQQRAIDELYRWFLSGNAGNPCIEMPTGCHAKGQGILMANGDVSLVENINIGDRVMGGDGTGRTVVQLHRGSGQMYKVAPKKGDPFIVNEDHVLSLISTNEGKKNFPCRTTGKEIVNLTVKEYLPKSKSWKHKYKLYRGIVETFEADSRLTVPPYIVGILLGDGSISGGRAGLTTLDQEVLSAWEEYSLSIGCHLVPHFNEYKICPTYYAKTSNGNGHRGGATRGKSNVRPQLEAAGIWGMATATKAIPHRYKVGSYEDRLQIIAGLLDTDGSLQKNCFDFISKSEQLSKDLVFVCRSVGLAAYCTPCKETCCNNGVVGEYFRVCISGDTHKIPTRIERKKAIPRKQKKRVEVTGFDIEPIGKGEFFGFEVDGDHLYMLDDFTVTHNSGKSHVIAELCRDVIQSWPDQKILILTHVKELIEQDAEKILMAWPSAPMGIYSAGLGMRQLGEPITIAGIQSVRKRAQEIGHIDLVIVDEAHLISHKEEGGYRKLISDLQKINPSLRVIGLTATPYRLGHGLITDKPALFDDILTPTSIEELIAKGYLAPLRSKDTELKLSTDGVAKRGGEFVESDLQRAVNTSGQNSRIVDEVLARAGDRKGWLFFCSGVDHAIAMRNILLKRGIPAACVLGETPKDERNDILTRFKSGELRAVTNANVLCLDEETEILTSRGFVGIDEMNPDHLIAGWKPGGQIDFATPEQIVRRNRIEGEQMVVFGGGMAAEIRVTGNHRMVVQSGAKRASIKVVPANTLIGKSFSIPAFGESHPICMDVPTPTQRKTSFSKQVIANSYNYRKKGYSKEEARKKAEELAFRRLSMEYKKPNKLSLRECQFIGFWLGDGTISAGRMSISQSMVYRDIVEEAEVIFKECGLHYTKSITPKNGNMQNDAVRWSFSRGTGGDKQEVTGGFFHLEPYLKKRGTNLFLGLSKDQLKALLYGLWLADGIHHGVSNRKNSYVAGTQSDLYNVLQAACSMRGISSTLSRLSSPRKENHSQQWIFSWGGRNSFCYTKKSSRIETGWKKERVWCVTSSTSFLICRRKGKVFVTGNTTGFDYPDIDLIAMCRPTMSPGLYLQMAGRGMRIKSHIDDCLFLDFAGLVRTHGPVTAVQPPVKGGTGTGEAPVKVCEECHELVHLAVRVCPACGHEFPPPQPKPLKLRNDDIMGKTNRMPVRAWEWARRTSFTSGKTMATVTYYGESYTEAVTEYFCLLHGGYAGQKAMQKLFRIARLAFQNIPDEQAAANEEDLSFISGYLGNGDSDAMDSVIEMMNELPFPTSIAYHKDGKFFNTYDWEWVQMIEKTI